MRYDNLKDFVGKTKTINCPYLGCSHPADCDFVLPECCMPDDEKCPAEAACPGWTEEGRKAHPEMSEMFV